ncbi:MAG: hypothetical protein ACRETC_01450 [Gammaproteobacteria bacterium]
MATFEVHGPFEMPVEKRPGGRALVFTDFWNDGSEADYLAGCCGVYVFAIQTGRGLTPIYVGKATRTFRQETFNNANKHKYQNGFSAYARGKPVMYFVVHPQNIRGRNNAKQISKIEDFLIQAGSVKNPDLQNIRGVKKPKWAIKGVIRSKRGRRTSAEVQFSGLFDIHKKSPNK